MSAPQSLSAGLEKILATTNDCLRACALGDPDALHKALDEREALIQACATLSPAPGRSNAKIGLTSVCAAIERLNADLEDAASRLRDAVATELAAASRAKSAVGDYLVAGQPVRRFDRAL
ncbi:MAG: hypothetical protein AB1762_09585 [Gemmatimonadota bacterium]